MTRVVDDQVKKQACGTEMNTQKDFIDLEVRNLISVNRVIMPIIKCMNRYNHCGLRDMIANNNMVKAN